MLSSNEFTKRGHEYIKSIDSVKDNRKTKIELTIDYFDFVMIYIPRFISKSSVYYHFLSTLYFKAIEFEGVMSKNERLNRRFRKCLCETKKMCIKYITEVDIKQIPVISHAESVMKMRKEIGLVNDDGDDIITQPKKKIGVSLVSGRPKRSISRVDYSVFY
jgi:hypothetical protein